MKILNQFKRIAILFFVCIGFLYPSISIGQFWMSKYGHLGNYYLIRDSTDAFFKEDTSRISDKDFGFKHYQRWKTFLEPRVKFHLILQKSLLLWNS